MTAPTIPELAKWPFLVGDLLLLGIATWIVKEGAAPLEPWPLFFLVVCVGGGAWIGVAPFIMEYRGRMKFAESQELADTVQEVKKLETVGEQVENATAQWHVIQENAERAVRDAEAIGLRMCEESKAFKHFMEKANDTEKNHLRLEVDKLRRSEADWLQVLVRVLDHIHALYLAGERSGQEGVRKQLNNFQTACRETVRRLGLVPIDARAGDAFNANSHEVAVGANDALPGSIVEQAVATGYTYQGQLIRKVIVQVQSPSVAAPHTASAAKDEELTRQAKPPAANSEEDEADEGIGGLSGAATEAKVEEDEESVRVSMGEDSAVDEIGQERQDDLIHWSTEEEPKDT